MGPNCTFFFCYANIHRGGRLTRVCMLLNGNWSTHPDIRPSLVDSEKFSMQIPTQDTGQTL